MIRTKLREDAQLLEKQLSWLTFSFEECSMIGTKEEYSIDEFGKFETLCSRYARSIDFLIRKMFRTLDTYEFEDQGTLVDIVNRAHKRGLFEDMEQVRLMKDLRNTIVHEYIEDELRDLFEEVLHYTEELIRIMQTTLRYTQTLEN
jgi:uncharacterized protein YutE (UPF0331/DUF86 family)